MSSDPDGQQRPGAESHPDSPAEPRAGDRAAVEHPAEPPVETTGRPADLSPSALAHLRARLVRKYH